MKPATANRGGIAIRAVRVAAAAVSAVILTLPALAQPRCDLPETGLPELEKAERFCQAVMPDSRTQCGDFLSDLAAIENPSLDQALALAFGQVAAARVGAVKGAITKADISGRAVLKPFVNAEPDDPMLLNVYASFHSDDVDTHAELLRRVLTLDPACSSAAFELASYALEEDDDRQAAEYLTLGYEHSLGMWKLLLAFMKYQSLHFTPAEAAAFRAQVAADVGSRHMLADGDEAPELYWALVRQVLALDRVSLLRLGLGEFRGDDEHNGRADWHLTVEYEHSEGTWELLVAFWNYESLRQSGQPEEAEAFRAEVAADLASRPMPLDVENRAGSLNLLCNGNMLKLRLEVRCNAAVEELVARDRLADVPLGADLLEAIDSLSGVAEHGDFGDAGARYHERLWQLLEAEPEQYRSAEFYVVYSRVLRPTAGVEAEAEALRRALDLDPRSGEIGLYLAGAGKRAGWPAQKINDVYRHVIANADDRSFSEGMPVDHYMARATQLLNELEGEGSPQTDEGKARP